MLPPNLPLNLLRAAALLCAGGLMTGFILYSHRQANLTTPARAATPARSPEAPASGESSPSEQKAGLPSVKDTIMFASSKSGKIKLDLPSSPPAQAPAAPLVIASGSKSIDARMFIQSRTLELQPAKSAPVPNALPAKLTPPKVIAPRSKMIGNVFPTTLLDSKPAEESEVVDELSFPADLPAKPAPKK